MDKPLKSSIKELRRDILKTIDVEEVYITPPENVKLVYPCAILNISEYGGQRANNSLYKKRVRYEILVITYSLDESIFEKLLTLQYCSANAPVYITNGLYHYKLSIYK